MMGINPTPTGTRWQRLYISLSQAVRNKEKKIIAEKLAFASKILYLCIRKTQRHHTQILYIGQTLPLVIAQIFKHATGKSTMVVCRGGHRGRHGKGIINSRPLSNESAMAL